MFDDYGYLDIDLNILVNYLGGDYYNDIGIFGEYFLNNWFVVVDIRDVRDLDNYILGIGYLFVDVLKVFVNRDVCEYGDDYFCLKV